MTTATDFLTLYCLSVAMEKPMSAENGEGVQILRYEHGQKYEVRPPCLALNTTTNVGIHSLPM